MDCRHIWMTRLAALVIAFQLAAPAAVAQVVQACDIAQQLDLIATPEDLNMRHFANGAVLTAIVDDGRDDVGTALSMLVVSPPLDAHGERQCRLVRLTQDDGFAALLLDTAVASYDPSRGLNVVLAGIAVRDPDATIISITLSVTINQATGDVTANVQESVLN